MAMILDRAFSGEIPKLSPNELPPGSASLAMDCDFSRGDLRPLRADSEMTGETSAANINSAIRGLFYSRELDRTIYFDRPTYVTRHTTNGTDRYFVADGVSPVSTSRLSDAVIAGTAALSAGVVDGLQHGSQRLTASSFGPDAPTYEPNPVGDAALSEAYLAGDQDVFKWLRYGIAIKYAIKDSIGAVGDFTSVDAIGVNWVDQPGVASWITSSGFYHKNRELKGTVALSAGEDIVLMAQFYSAYGVNGVETPVPLGVAYSQNHTSSDGSISANTPGESASSAPLLDTGYKYPTNADYPDYDKLNETEIKSICAAAMVYSATDPDGFEPSQRARAAMQVQWARGNASLIYGTPPVTVDLKSLFGNSFPSPLATQQSTSVEQEPGAKTPVVSATLSDSGLISGQPVTFRLSKVKANGSAPTGKTLYDIAATLQIGVVESRSYCTTFFNEFGEESAPSPASRIINVDQGHCVRVSIDPPADWPNVYQNPTETISAANAANIDSAKTVVRVYRTVTSSSGETRYHFFKEVGFANYLHTVRGGNRISHSLAPVDLTRPSDSNYRWFDWIDTLDAKQAQEPIATMGFRRPPKDMTHLQPFGNNTLCGISGDEVLFSEMAYPYAWPLRNRVKAQSRIKAAAVTANGVLLATEDGFSIAVGNEPASMGVHRLPSSSVMIGESFASIGDALVALTSDGLAMINGVSVDTSLADKLWSVDDWLTRWVPSERLRISTPVVGDKLVGVFCHNKRVVVLGNSGGFVVDVATGALSRLSGGYYAGSYAQSLDSLLVLGPTSRNTGKVSKFAESLIYRSMEYVSREFRFERAVCLGVMKVVAGESLRAPDNNPGAFRSVVHVDCKIGSSWVQVTPDAGLQVWTQEPNGGMGNSNKFEFFTRLKRKLSTRWRYRVTGRTAIREIHIAETMQEIQSA